MNAIQTLLTDHLDIWTAADAEKKSGRGRSSGNAASVYGIKKLRELILELAVRGKLVPQDANDEPASELLKRVKANIKPISDDQKPFDLPQGWEWVRLGQVVEVLDSLRKPVTKQDRESGPYPYYGASGVVDYVSNYIFDEPLVLVGEDGAKWGRGESTAFLIAGKTWVNNHAHVIRPYRTAMNDDFVACSLNAMNLGPFITGMTVPKLNQARLVSIVLPLPPLAEQHRIVAKVDEMMALCDQLETRHNNAAEAHEKLVSHLLGTLTLSQSAEDFSTNWQRIAAHFDTLFTTEASITALKQTLLQLAVMGKLVPQDPNDEPASELLKRIQAEKARLIAEGKIKKDKALPSITDEEKPFELPKSWGWVRLGDISSTVQYGYTDSANHQLRDVLFLRITDIQDDAVNWTTVPGCSISLSDFNSYALGNNDLVIARTGGTIGKSYLVTGLNQKAVFASYLIKIGNLSSTSAEYKKVFLGSILYWRQLIASSMGTGQPNVNGTALKNLIFSLPPLAEQRRIVAKLDELMALCDQLETRITAASQLQQKLAEVMVEQAVA